MVQATVWVRGLLFRTHVVAEGAQSIVSGLWPMTTCVNPCTFDERSLWGREL